MVAATVRTDPTFAAGERRVLFPAAGYVLDYNHRAYDVLPGDSVFVMVPLSEQGGNHLVVVDNVFRELWEKVGR
jgi:hypothetical protein